MSRAPCPFRQSDLTRAIKAYVKAGIPAERIRTAFDKNGRPVIFVAKPDETDRYDLMQYAVSANLCEVDPTQGIKLKTPKSDGIYTWNEQDIAAYEAVHGVGTKARLAFALGLYTAQRRNDVLRMGRQHIHDGILSVKQQKTGAALRIPVHPDLRAIIDATPGGHLTFLLTRTGKPYAGDNFSEQFRAWCKAARLPEKCSFHGLRKAACRRLAEAGCSVNEIAAISGHATLREVQRYTKAVDQERMARAAMARQVNDIATTGVKSG
jgi:integrase